MRRIFSTMLCYILAVIGLMCSVSRASGGAIYVSIAGDDNWSGRLPAANSGRTDGPLATLSAARDAIRSLNGGQLPINGVTVYVRGGIYFLSSTFELGAADSGTAEKPIVYRACEDEEVRLIGGREVKGFGAITDSKVLGRIEEKFRRNILQLDLKSQEVGGLGKLRNRGFGRSGVAGLELFFQDRPMQLARWPNAGWVKIASVPGGKDGGRFGYEGDRPKRWLNADDVWVHGFWTHDWADSYEKVASIDTEKRVISTVPPHGAYGYTKGKRFYALNLLEELDSPGEWYLERETGILYFWPPAPPAQGAAFVSTIDTIISMKDVSYVTFRGMTIECTRGTAVRISGGKGNLIAGCTIRNIGNRGVSISGGTNNGVAGCDIYETGDGGIGLLGGDRKTLRPCNNFAENNHIHHYSRWCLTYRPAIGVSGVGNRVSHNLIHDGPHNAIQLGGNDNVIEYNEIFNVCTESDDVGAFYMGRDWTMRSNVIRHNFFHHIHSAAEQYRHGSRVVYLDDAASGTTIHGNVFYKAGSLCAVNVGGGRDNIITNNVFVDCVNGVLIDARGLGWAKGHAAKGGGWGMYRKLADVNFDKPPYSERYPALARILDENPAAPRGNVVSNNICVGGKLLNMPNGHEDLVAQKGNLTDSDPMFVDKAKLDFQFRDKSPAYKLGFEKIPFAKIGLYADRYRKSVSGRADGKGWMKKSKFGVFVHYLGGGDSWNDKVNSFDAPGFVDQVARTKADYVVFTLGQNSGYYCSPNAAYSRYAGYEEGDRCSGRDLPMEIADGLGERGIKLMLYLPSRSPQRDARAMKGLEDVHERQPAPQGFTKKWSEVIAEWSKRYGLKVAGWWFDGSYNTAGWDDLSKPYNWNTWAAAARAGNPYSMLAFNPGTRIDKAFSSLTAQQDYTAGEQNSFTATPKKNPCPAELQWQLLTFMGNRWGAATGPHKSDEWMTNYIRQINGQGGIVTIDVNISDDGTIYGPHLKQLVAIGTALNAE
ncbi:MAG: right-handed parallel beta-helix repeat-containing protein [Planctomycetes bacterium]|nr:right-handed parallel beta-helix repeat-containing protein [Planctomycetota bacterium]